MGGSLKSGRYRIQISSRRVSIYILKTKVSWIEIPEDVPAFEEGYDFETLWPSEGYTRFMKFF